MCKASKSSEFVLEGSIAGCTCSSQWSSRAGSNEEGSEGDDGESIELDHVGSRAGDVTERVDATRTRLRDEGQARPRISHYLRSPSPYLLRIELCKLPVVKLQ